MDGETGEVKANDSELGEGNLHAWYLYFSIEDVQGEIMKCRGINSNRPLFVIEAVVTGEGIHDFNGKCAQKRKMVSGCCELLQANFV